MITVWFAPDVIEKMRNQGVSMQVCEGCVTQYLQGENRKTGRIEASPRVQAQLCNVISEALATIDPYLRGLLTVSITDISEDATRVEVRMSATFNHLIHSQPGSAHPH